MDTYLQKMIVVVFVQKYDGFHTYTVVFSGTTPVSTDMMLHT